VVNRLKCVTDLLPILGYKTISLDKNPCIDYFSIYIFAFVTKQIPGWHVIVFCQKWFLETLTRGQKPLEQGKSKIPRVKTTMKEKNPTTNKRTCGICVFVKNEWIASIRMKRPELQRVCTLNVLFKTPSCIAHNPKSFCCHVVCITGATHT